MSVLGLHPDWSECPRVPFRKFVDKSAVLWFAGDVGGSGVCEVARTECCQDRVDRERADELEALLRRCKTGRGDAMRALIVLLAAEGLINLATAERPGTTRVTVASWRDRFAKQWLDSLSDEPRPGAPRKIGDDKIVEVVTATLETAPRAATHWSTRSMARASGLSVTTVHCVWQAFLLRPHQSETFKLSTDPPFVDKVCARPSQPWPQVAGVRLGRRRTPPPDGAGRSAPKRSRRSEDGGSIRSDWHFSLVAATSRSCRHSVASTCSPSQSPRAAVPSFVAPRKPSTA